MSRLLKSQNYLMNYFVFVLLLGFISLGAIGGCSDNGSDDNGGGLGHTAPDDDDTLPRIDYEKEGLFTSAEALFDDMFAGNFEEWTLINCSFSDHPFHIHVNPFLVTHINGEALPEPEWRDTILVPAATGGQVPGSNSRNINLADYGTITFRTYLDPLYPGSFVFHCHILTHEDVGMMQKITVLP